ncbi:MAG: nodulation protein NfeD [Dehalococcoidia bacterium]
MSRVLPRLVRRFRLPPRRVRLLLWALLLVGGLAIACGARIGERGAIHVLTADGQVDPVMERYIDRGIDEAERTDAVAVVLRLDTPGGLDSSMRDIVQRIQASKVPVMVYVWPAGARAASAGTFITMAGHIAAMAPNTAIGAAHPVAIGGAEIEGTMEDKVTNDAVAYIKGIARLRDRNEEWAEKAVRESDSIHQDEAVELNVIDFVARDLDDLIQQAEGQRVDLPDGPATLRLADAPVVENNMSLIEQFLSLISDANVAFLLLSLGATAIFFELLNPGAIFPGVFGAIALLLGFFALGTLPWNWAGVLLILLAFALFAAEVFVSGFGVLGIGGVVALILGGLLLTSTSNPDFQVSRWLIYGMAAVIGAFFIMVVSALVRSRRLPAATGPQAMIGRQAVARSSLDPDGIVFMDGARWTARAEGGRVEKGDRVVITDVKGLKLTVKKTPGEEEAKTGG